MVHPDLVEDGGGGDQLGAVVRGQLQPQRPRGRGHRHAPRVGPAGDQREERQQGGDGTHPPSLTPPGPRSARSDDVLRGPVRFVRPAWWPAVDVAALVASWCVVVLARSALGDLLGPLEVGRAWPVGLLLVGCWAASLAAVGAWRREAPSGVLLRAALVATALDVVVSWLLRWPVNRSLPIGMAVVAVLGLTALRALRPRARRRVVVVGPDRARVEGLLVASGATVVPRGGEGADELWVAGQVSSEELLELAEEADRRGLPLTLDATHTGPRTARAELRQLGDWTGVTFRPATETEPARIAKRVLDLLGAVALLALSAPVLAVIAALIRWQDGGPILFVQERVGRYGRPFRMLKLRTMVPDAERRLPEVLAHNEIAGPAFKMRGDPRVTPVGRWLRRFSLDELPQLVNVLQGHMSLVGPRPPLPVEVAGWERWQWRRLSVRPGMTGLWQVSGRADLPWDVWIRLDLDYVDRWSLWLDLALLARTIPVVLAGTGAR
ncbi:MAG: exopolysaccharide biosynthesis polyprenyl glycosylphosphotransferase [Alphaproteobacteria bacterium]|nr:exopolysaccharide biosynthesis polyprenyl glycosylphosphotransferase [Alphaproteobacteria bacterium]